MLAGMRLILLLFLASTTLAQSIPFNRVQQKHTHNSYARDEGLLDQLSYYAVRSLELDIHPSDVTGNWDVYHEDDSRTTSCKLLSDCLAIIGSMNGLLPRHEPVTIWIELKEGGGNWNSTHTPQQFDALFRQYLGAENLYIPDQLLKSCTCSGSTCPNLQAAVKTCGWPTLDALEKKFFVAMLEAGSGGLDGYIKNTGSDRVAYLQGNASDPGSDPNRVFFNGNPSKTAADFVTRITTANDQDAWAEAVTAGYQYLGTDKVNFYADSWSRTNDPLGWPFRCASCGLQSETERMMYIDAVSGDLGGPSDNLTFLYTDAGASPDNTWTVTVGGSGDSTQAAASGCLMARADTTAGAPFVAVCRFAADRAPRFLFRDVPGATAREVELETTYAWQYAFLKLDLTQSGTTTCASGWASRTSASQLPIASLCIPSPLPLQGISAAAADDVVNARAPRVRFLFTNLQRGTTPAGFSDLTRTNIGNVATTASAGSGFFPGDWWFTYQTKWGTRQQGAGYSGAGQWIAQMTGSIRQDYVYNPDGTKDVNVLRSTGQSLAAEERSGTRSYGSQYGATGQFFADVDLDTAGASDLVYDRAESKEIRILRSNGSKLGSDEKWGTRSSDVASDGKRQWVVNVSTDLKLDVVYNSSSNTKEIRVLVNNGQLGSDTKWGARTYEVEKDAVWLADINGDGRADYVYARDDSTELRVLTSTGTSFNADVLWKNHTYDVAFGGNAQWLGDLDYLYNTDATRELRAMLNTNGTLGNDVFWGDRMWGIGYEGLSQWVTDLNGDCRADFVYSRDQTREYWALLSTGTQFSIDQWRGNRAWGIGFDGQSDWLGRLQPNSMHDQINNRDGTRDYWAMVPQSTQPAGTCWR